MTVRIRFQPGLKPIIEKHQQHDQQSHGNWASSTEIESLDYIPDSESQPDLYSDDFFREEIDQNIANLYKANMSKKDLEVKGLEKKSLNLEYYTGTGFEEVNNYLRDNSTDVDSDLDNSIELLDNTIDNVPPIFKDKNLYRVSSRDLFNNLEEGDIFFDKGFMSTTLINLTKSPDARAHFSLIDGNVSDDIVMQIRPSKTSSGKGVHVNGYFLLNARTYLSDKPEESEVLLPRKTKLKFLGFEEGVNMESEIAVFERMN